MIDFNERKCVYIGIGSAFFSLASLIWGLLDLEFTRKGVEIIYIIVLSSISVCLIGLIILAIREKKTVFKKNNNLCCLIMFLCIVTFILMLVNSIILIVDYADLEKSLGPGQQISDHEWAAVFVPSIITLLSLIFIGITSFTNYEFI